MFILSPLLTFACACACAVTTHDGHTIKARRSKMRCDTDRWDRSHRSARRSAGSHLLDMPGHWPAFLFVRCSVPPSWRCTLHKTQESEEIVEFLLAKQPSETITRGVEKLTSSPAIMYADPHRTVRVGCIAGRPAWKPATATLPRSIMVRPKRGRAAEPGGAKMRPTNFRAAMLLRGQ